MKFVGKAGKFVGKAGKFVGKAENSWARRKIRGQGARIREQGGKFVGRFGARLAHEFSALPTNFPPCPRIPGLAHEFSALPSKPHHDRGLSRKVCRSRCTWSMVGIALTMQTSSLSWVYVPIKV